MHDQINQIIQASIDVKLKVLENKELQQMVARSVTALVTAFKNGNKVLFCGNGGSAADAQHLAAEFSGRFYTDREALPAEALHVNTSYITAVANDYSYDVVYSRMVQGIGKKGDVLVGLSTSGNSTNIIKAFETARAKEMITIGFTGATGGKMKDISDLLINVPSTDTPRIQESHILLGTYYLPIGRRTIFCKILKKGMTTEAIILAGGLGTRLRSAVPDLPKCMAPVAGKPFLHYLIDYLLEQGVESFIFSLGYMHEVIEAYILKNYPHLNYQISIEKEPLGTGGAIQLACNKATTENVLVINGDTMFKVNTKKLLAFHDQHKAACTLSLKTHAAFFTGMA